MSKILLAANYSCSDSVNDAYGEGAYSTCEVSGSNETTNAEQTTGVGAPNTGFMQQMYAGGSFIIIVPLIIAVVLVGISAIVLGKKKSKQ